MTKVMTFFVVLSFIAQVASANCLTNVPTTQSDLDRQIKIAKMRYSDSADLEKEMGSIARDADLTSAQSKLVAGLGVAPFATLMTLYYGEVSLFSGNIGALAKTVGLSIGSYIGWAQIVKGIKNIAGFSDIQIDKISKDLRSNIQSEKVSCSFDDLHKKLAEARKSIFEHEMNGSVLNAVRDRLTLGSLSKKGTLDLYAISALERELRSVELKQLSQVKIPSSAKEIKPAAIAVVGSR